MKQVYFNVLRQNSNDHKPYGGKKMDIKSYSDILTVRDNIINVAQIFNNGSRMNNTMLYDNNMWEYWNGICYEDIDYKKYVWYCQKNNIEYVNPDEMFNKVNEYMLINYWFVFAYSEMSRSKISFHYYFYFDVKDKNENNWFRCKELSIGMIKEAFVQCGYKNELEFNGVYDDCTNSPVQCIFITKIKPCINNACIGDYSMLDKDAFRTVRLVTRSEKIAYQNKKREIRKSKVYKYNVTIREPENVEYLPHSLRWSLFCSLSVLFDDDDLKRNWERCAEYMIEDNGHTVEYYKKVPYYLDWYRNLTGSESMNTKLLNMFGYYVNWTSKPKTKLPSFLTQK